MKKLITLFLLLGSFSLASASIDQNLKYGQTNTEVRELQDFLQTKGFLNQTTGFFGLLTLNAVKQYQSSTDLPSTGYVGILTRTQINGELALAIASSAEAEVAETGTTTPVVPYFPPAPVIVYVPQYITQPAPVQVIPPTSVPVVIPTPTCTIAMEYATTTEGTSVASTTITSLNATKRVLVQTSPQVGTVGVSTSTNENNQNVNYTHNVFGLPMKLDATFSGQGGTVTCSAELK